MTPVLRTSTRLNFTKSAGSALSRGTRVYAIILARHLMDLADRRLVTAMDSTRVNAFADPDTPIAEVKTLLGGQSACTKVSTGVTSVI